MVMKIQVAVLRIVTLCNDVVGYHHFGGLCCLHLPVSQPRRMRTLISHCQWCSDIPFPLEQFFLKAWKYYLYCKISWLMWLINTVAS